MLKQTCLGMFASPPLLFRRKGQEDEAGECGFGLQFIIIKFAAY
jgi:hypothetical protein